MDGRHILNSMSFAALDEEAQRVICEHAFLFLSENNEDILPEISMTDVLKQQKSLSVTLSIYGAQLAQTNPASLHYLSNEEKATLEQDLVFSFYIFSAQYQLEKAQGKNSKHRNAQMKQCAFLLKELRTTPEIGTKKSPQALLAAQVDDSEKHLKYLGLTTIAPFLMQQTRNVFFNQHDNIELLLTDLNNKRRYWIWASGLLSRVFEALSINFYNIADAQKIFAENDVSMNYLSWIILYARWGVHLGSIAHHVIIGATAEENKISRSDRFTSEWTSRKYDIIQDTLSISVGLMCTFWAVANSPFAQYAAPLSVLLRLLSLAVIMKQYAEKCTDRTEQLLRFDKDIVMMEDKILLLVEKQNKLEQKKNNMTLEQAARQHVENSLILMAEMKLRFEQLEEELEALRMSKIVLERQMNSMYKNKRKYKAEWHLQENAILLEMALATGLLTGVCFMACAFFPPLAIVPMVATILNLTGISICFSAIVAQSVFKGHEKITTSEHSSKSLSEENALLLIQFKECKNENERKLLFLDMKALHQKSEYQQQLVTFQKMKVIHTVLIQALLPAVIFTTFVLMPAAGIALLGVGFLLAVASEQYLNSYKPKELLIPDFNEEEYEAFVQNPTLDTLKTQHMNAPAAKKISARPNAGADSALDETELLDHIPFQHF